MSLGDFKVELRRLAATITACNRAGTVSASTVDLGQVGLIGRTSVSVRDVIDAVVDKEGDGSEVCSLIAAVLGSGGGEGRGEFANQSTGSPKATSLVKECRDLCRGAAVTGGEAQDQAVVFNELFGSNYGVVLDRFLVGVHLGKDLFGKSLLNLVDIDGSSTGFFRSSFDLRR